MFLKLPAALAYSKNGVSGLAANNRPHAEVTHVVMRQCREQQFPVVTALACRIARPQPPDLMPPWPAGNQMRRGVRTRGSEAGYDRFLYKNAF